MTTLLPSHRPEIEKAIDVVAGERFEALPITDIDTNPETCHESILWVLAASFNVDISGLDIAQARRLVASGFVISRHRGTVYAVKKAIAAFHTEGELIEYPDKPYIFGVKIPAELIAEISQQQILCRLLDSAKNVRSSYEIEAKSKVLALDIYKTTAITITLKGESKTEFVFNGLMTAKSGVALRI
jgi:phage tail P2-like protein